MAQQSRREFLEQSMFAATAAAMAGGVVVQPRDVRAAGPNDVLRVAVIGVNGRGGEHLKGYLALPDQCEVVAICDCDEAVGMTKGVATVEKATKKAPKFYKDVRKLLQDKEIDAVSIATPNHWHALGAIWAIQAGKDVYVEKPVSHNVSEGRRIVEAARKHKKICQAGTQSRAAAGTREFMEFLHKGGLGEINLARGLCYKTRKSIGPRGNYPVPASVDFDLWCGPAPQHAVTRPKFHYDWHWQWDYGNGDLGNQGIHQVDLGRWGLNVDGLCHSIVSYGGRYGYTDAGETANTQVAIFDFGPKKTLVFEVRGLTTDDYKGARVGVVFTGTEGYAVMGSYTGAAVFDKAGKLVRKFNASGDHFLNFLQAVRSRDVGHQFADVEVGHVSSALCHLANISYRLGQLESVSDVRGKLHDCKANDNCLETFDRFSQHLTAGNHVDLEKEKIRFGSQLLVDTQHEKFIGPNADQANEFLTRAPRKGYVVPAAGQV